VEIIFAAENNQEHDMIDHTSPEPTVALTAPRAELYRAALDRLLTHRISRFERWTVGLQSIVVGASLMVGGIAMASIHPRPASEGFDQTRWTVAIACILTGILFAGWLLRIAIHGGYARRVGDVVGVIITTVFCGGWGAAFIEAAWSTSDLVLRTKLLGTGSVLFLMLAGCVLLALIQRMHRQTQEKLLKVEYALAELLARGGE
jgi:hypothetical protein